MDEAGRCACEQVRFRIDQAPLWVVYCHCVSCRRHTGAPVTVYVGMRRDGVVFTGSPRQLRESSPGVRRSFCGQCGTPIAYEADWCADQIHLHVSGFEHPESFVPTRHVLANERLAWFDTHDMLPRFIAGTKEPIALGPDAGPGQRRG